MILGEIPIFMPRQTPMAKVDFMRLCFHLKEGELPNNEPASCQQADFGDR